jgi:hypothetical protein
MMNGYEVFEVPLPPNFNYKSCDFLINFSMYSSYSESLLIEYNINTVLANALFLGILPLFLSLKILLSIP